MSSEEIVTAYEPREPREPRSVNQGRAGRHGVWLPSVKRKGRAVEARGMATASITSSSEHAVLLSMASIYDGREAEQPLIPSAPSSASQPAAISHVPPLKPDASPNMRAL